MVRKKISACLVALLIFMQCLYGTNFFLVANAAAISSNIIDSVTMTVYNSSGQVVTGDVYEQGSKVQLNYNWSLPNGHGYHDNDTFTFTLPQEFLLFNNISGPLMNDEDAGTFQVNASTRQVTITFNDFIQTHDDVQGTLTFNTQFNVQTITGSTTQTIRIPVKSGEQVLTLHFKPNVTTTVAKSGTPEGFNPKNINWTVDVNKALDSVENAVVTDPIPTGLNVPVTVAVYDLNMSLDGTATQGSLVDPSKYTVSTTGGTLSVSFAVSPIKSAYRIWYATPITDPDKTSFTNTATFSGSNKAASNASATVTVKSGSYLSKSPYAYNSSTQTVTWEIKYNYNERSIPQADANITDLFDNSQQLVAGSVHVYPVTFDSAGTESVGVEVSASDYTVVPAVAAGKDGFKLQFGNPVTTAYKISYQSEAVDRVLDNATVANNVTSGSGKSVTATKSISQVVIGKSVGTVDYQAHTAAWTITLNTDNQSMSDVVVTDTFPYKGMEFIPSSLVVKQGATVLHESADFTLDSPDVKDGFKISLTHSISGPVTISYKTTFNNDWISPVNSTTDFVNTAAVNWTDSTSTARTKSVTTTFTPRDEVKNNGFKSGSYNAVSKQITWTVGLNYNSKSLSNAVLEDQLNAGQSLVDQSLAVYNMVIPPSGNPSIGTAVDASDYQYSVSADNKLVVTFNQPITTPYYVIFKTSLDGQLIESTVSNTAVLYDGTDKASKNLTASVSIPNGGEYVSKSGAQSDDHINWTVYINRNQSTVEDAEVVDTPSDNQMLMPATFHLYSTSVDTAGNVTKGAELTKGTDFSLSINTDDDGKQSFVLDFPQPISKAYILEYQSLITANDKDTVSNAIRFNGNNVINVTKTTSSSVVVGVSSGSGTISGVRGSLTVLKKDASDSSVLLGGATFELYRKSGSGKVLINTATTDATGAAVFKKLLSGDYIVKETVAPAGYQLDSSEHAVTINSTAGFTLTITNNRIPTPTPTVTVTPTPSASSSTAVVSPSPSPSTAVVVSPSPSPSTAVVVTASPSPSAAVTTPSPTPAATSDSSDSKPAHTSKATPTPSSSPATPTPSGSSQSSPSATGSAAPEHTPSSTSSAAPTTAPTTTPASTSAAVPTPAVEQKTTTEDTPITGHIDVPLGGKPSVKEAPQNGTIKIDPNGDWTYTPNPGFSGKDSVTIVIRDKNGKEEEILMDIDVQKVPLAPPQDNGLPGQTLPKTGEASHRNVQIAGLLLVILGILLRKRTAKSQ